MTIEQRIPPYVTRDIRFYCHLRSPVAESLAVQLPILISKTYYVKSATHKMIQNFTMCTLLIQCFIRFLESCNTLHGFGEDINKLNFLKYLFTFLKFLKNIFCLKIMQHLTGMIHVVCLISFLKTNLIYFFVFNEKQLIYVSTFLPHLVKKN